MDSGHSGKENSNTAKKRVSNPSSPVSKSKRSKSSVALYRVNEVDNEDFRFESDGGDSGNEDSKHRREVCSYYDINKKQMELNCEKHSSRKCDSKSHNMLINDQTEDTDGEGSNCSFVGNFSSMKRCREMLCRMIVMERLPFRIVDGEWFRAFSLSLPSKFDIPSHRTIMRDCFQLYLEERRKLKNMLVEKQPTVCLSAETWTSMRDLNYMVIAAHFIDDNWKLQKKILNFSSIPDRKGDTIGKTIENCLLNWGIEKVLTITVDNASYNDEALCSLRKKLNNESGVVLNGDFMHVRSCTDIVNLMVCDVLKEFHGSIMKIRNAIVCVNSSPEILENFKNFARDESISCIPICLDIPHKWNTTYTMLESALRFQKVFERLEVEDEEFCLKKDLSLSEDWDNVRALMKLLKIFRRITWDWGSTTCRKSDKLLPNLCTIKNKIERWSRSDNSLLVNVARRMKMKYEPFWEMNEKTNFHIFLYVSNVLDPRYKLDFLFFCLEMLYGEERSKEIGKKVEDMTRCLYNEYRTSNTSMDEPSVKDEEKEKNCNSFISLRTRFLMYQKATEKPELDRYLSDRCEPDNDVNFDILEWWRMHSSNYKVLGKIAKDIFAIPLSTNVLEPAFSIGDRVLDLYHSSLPPKTAEVVICLRNWLSSETTEKLQLQELEDEWIMPTDMEMG